MRMHANIMALEIDKESSVGVHFQLDFKNGEITLQHCPDSVRRDIYSILPAIIDLVGNYKDLDKYLSIDLPGEDYAYKIEQIIEHAEGGGYSDIVYPRMKVNSCSVDSLSVNL